MSSQETNTPCYCESFSKMFCGLYEQSNQVLLTVWIETFKTNQKTALMVLYIGALCPSGQFQECLQYCVTFSHNLLKDFGNI